ncbi:MAG: cytochrome c [Chitinophagaceae bacterium]|nr:MAG: cytochrome c [Chitinophagaceae bacterium]
MKIRLLLVAIISYFIVFSCSRVENKEVELSTNNNAGREPYQRKCASCHDIHILLIGPPLGEFTASVDAFVEKYKAEKKCHVGTGIVPEKELKLIIEYIKYNRIHVEPSV